MNPMPIHRYRNLAIVGLVALVTAWAPAKTAGANDKEACLEAYDRAQTLRQVDKLIAAREQLLVCARNVCPAILRKDCTQWLSEVDASMATVVFSVKDESGQDLVDVTVTVDGEPLVTQIDGKAVNVDPGVHTFRFEVEGEEAVEERIVIHAAAKNRNITIKIGDDAVVQDPATGSDKLVDDGGSSAPPTVAYVFGGVGLLGLGAFAFFGSRFQSKLNDMDTCKPNCTQSEADDASSTRTMAYASAGVGVVSLGVATYLFLSPSSDGKAAAEVSSMPQLDLVPVHGGALGSIGGRF